MFYVVRLVLLLLFDAAVVNLAVYLSLLLRFEGVIPQDFLSSFISLIPWITALTLISLYFFKLYNRMWQYASLGELYGIIKAISTSVVILILCIYTIPLGYLPRSVYILSWLLMIIGIGGSRLGWRILRDYILKEAKTEARKALIVGAGDGGALISREISNNPALGLTVAGFVDDNPMKQKMILYGIPVLGTRRKIPDIVKNYSIDEIIIAMPSVDGKTIREIMEICRQTPARLRIFPAGEALFQGSKRIRDIELEDLLRREPVRLNMDEIAAYLKGQVVLISGAGGSIGSELCRQVSMHGASKLVMVEYSENNLFEIENEIRELCPALEIAAELVDVKDKIRLQQVFSTHNPAVVFHAAAFKHVPMMEKHPADAIKNNIIGTKNMAESADKYKAKTFIFISTDKAVNPCNVMGATKRIAELTIQDFNLKSETRFAAVRFGNVLGSRGSVIPTFKKQIENGGPVTITHPDMTRYFMTIPEAVQLVVQAGAITQGGEIFVLDMGDPVKVTDLASDLIRLYGYEPGQDIEMKYTGIRPGEKLYEELFSSREQMAATRHERIFISDNPGTEVTNVREKVDMYFVRNSFINNTDALDFLHMFIPEYQGKNKSIIR